MKIRDIIRGVCLREGIAKDEFFSSCRQRRLAKVRWEVCHTAHNAGFSLQQIGLAIGRDHTTVLHHLRRESWYN
jgi:chromosomal replication initiation ATPase DnaA